VRRELRQRVAEAESRFAHDRMRAGVRVLGRRGVLRQSPRSHPTSIEPRRGLRPLFAARSAWSRVEALLRNRAFLLAYRDARARWIAGLPTIFPAGTYWLRRFAGVPIISLL
jgi:putative transposase